MPAEVQASPTSKRMFWAGWVVSGLVIVMLIFSGVMKLAMPGEIGKEFIRLGYSERAALAIGIVELACVVIYAIPATSVLGAILLTGYLGGATATHVRIEEGFAGPVIGGVLVWLGVFLRDARIRDLIPIKR